MMQLYSIAVDKGCAVTVGELVHVDDGTYRGDFTVTALWILNTIHIEIEVDTGRSVYYPVITIEDIEW